MPFEAGKSGNPGGRPRLTETARHVQELAQEKSAIALDVLVAIATDAGASPSARVSAASALLDRAWGRPAQATELTIQPVDTLGALLDKIRSRDLTNRSPA